MNITLDRVESYVLYGPWNTRGFDFLLAPADDDSLPRCFPTYTTALRRSDLAVLRSTIRGALVGGIPAVAKPSLAVQRLLNHGMLYRDPKVPRWRPTDYGQEVERMNASCRDGTERKSRTQEDA